MNVRHRPEICDRMKKVLLASTYLPCVEKESDFGRVIVGFAYLSCREKVTVFYGILAFYISALHILARKQA